ncbi:MAG TPA: hypothetical protein VHI55_05530 [Gaiellaceae bacterium]|jgi:hypothetical protein|nr:hypothetical protein [Gaiellaceae bacterium]
MLATEQTVVLLGRMTSFTAVCEACQEEQRAELLEESWLGARVSGTLRLEEDRGWATCERGHRVLLVREGGSAETTVL